MAGGGPEKGPETAGRRIARVASHLLPVPSAAPPPLHFSPAPPLLWRSPASADTYRRVHGEVPAHEATWREASDESGVPFVDIIYEKAVGEGIAKITINRPERRNAFRPQTVKELIRAFDDARDDSSIGVIILTGKGTKAFCSGGDQSVRKSDGYVDVDSFGRLNVLDLQVQIRRLPKPVIAMERTVLLILSKRRRRPKKNSISKSHCRFARLECKIAGKPNCSGQIVAGYAVGGGHVLHMVCDLTIAADNAVFGQTGPKVGSFDAGYGSSIMSRLVGPKKAREMWFLSRFYDAHEAEKMGLVNIVVPLERMEQETLIWCREILRNSPTAIRVLKSALNAVDDGHAGLQELAGNATLVFYGTEEAEEGKRAYMERRRPDFSKFPRKP